jgi:hypothetical protein
MQGILAVMLPPATVSIRYPVRPSPEAWVIPEGTVPEAPIHDEVAERLKLLLKAWAAREGTKLRIARNLALRFYEQDHRLGIDPDVCVLAPPPEDLDELGSLCLWKPGHFPPSICFEVVSLNHPNKDYVAIQDRYAALGTRELVVLDPTLAGPKSLGGPVPLQLWRRDPTGSFTRLHFGDAPVYSEALEGWIHLNGREVSISEDRAGKRPWLTDADHARADAERARASAERARASAERAEDALARERELKAAAERELAELKAQLAKR